MLSIEAFDSTQPLHAMLDGSGGVSHGRLVGSTMVVLRWCFERSDGLGSGGVIGVGRIVRGDVHSIEGVDSSA